MFLCLCVTANMDTIHQLLACALCKHCGLYWWTRACQTPTAHYLLRHAHYLSMHTCAHKHAHRHTNTHTETHVIHIVSVFTSFFSLNLSVYQAVNMSQWNPFNQVTFGLCTIALMLQDLPVFYIKRSIDERALFIYCFPLLHLFSLPLSSPGLSLNSGKSPVFTEQLNGELKWQHLKNVSNSRALTSISLSHKHTHKKWRGLKENTCGAVRHRVYLIALPC